MSVVSEEMSVVCKMSVVLLENVCTLSVVWMSVLWKNVGGLSVVWSKMSVLWIEMSVVLSVVLMSVVSKMSVLFPKMSQLQDDIHKLKDTARKSIRFSSYILCPMLLGLVAVSKQFVIIILTEKWLPCVPFLQLLCINSMCLPLHSTNMQMIKAMGRSDIALKVEIIKKIIELIVLLIVMRISVTAIVVGMVACSISFIFINAYPNIKLIGYTYKEQLSDLVPSIMMSIIMAIVVYTIGMINIPVFILLFIQIIVGILLYIFMSIITKNEQFKYLVHLVKSKIIKK